MDSTLRCELCLGPCETVRTQRHYQVNSTNAVNVNSQDGVLCHRCSTQCECSDLSTISLKSLDMTCDRSTCKSEGKLAAGICLDCEDKLCENHLQSHNSCYDDEHEVITTDDYFRSPAKYQELLHKKHKERSMDECGHCNRKLCTSCGQTKEGCKWKFQRQHSENTRKPTEEITSYLKQGLQQLDEKLVEIDNLDKRLWKDWETRDKKCDQWMEDIDTLKTEQLSMVAARCDRGKEKVDSYRQQLRTEVETMTNGLDNHKNRLKEVRTEIHNCMKDDHQMALVRRQQDLKATLAGCLELDLSRSTFGKGVVLMEGEPSGGELGLVQIPTSLQLHTHLETTCYCWSCCLRANGDILVACDDGLKVARGDTMTLIRTGLQSSSVHQVTEHHHTVYILCHENHLFKVAVCLPNLQQSQTLFEFEQKDFHSSSLAVTSTHIVVYVSVRQRPGECLSKLVTYDFSTNNMNIHLVSTDYFLYTAADGQLLVADSTRDQVRKCQMRGGELSTIRTFGLDKVNRVCEDSHGLIYACSNTKVISVFSPQGEKLYQMAADGLPADPGQFCVNDDKLFIPDSRSHEVKVFRLE